MLMNPTIQRESVLITTGITILPGVLDIPENASAVIVLANGLGRMKHTIAEPFADRLNEAGYATLSVDLLTPDEAQFDSRTSHFSSDSLFQAGRLRDIVEWLRENPFTSGLPIAAAAHGPAARGLLRAADADPKAFDAAIVESSVRPADVPHALTVPTLILTHEDPVALRRAESVEQVLAGPKEVRIVSSIEASHAPDEFFSDASGRIAAEWLNMQL